MTVSSSKIRQDFDRIAELPESGWNHNDHYHPFLLQYLPTQSDTTALDIGCGTGTFSRLLAQRFRRVLALDLSPRMIEVAKVRSRDYSNIDFQVADMMECPLPNAQFGCVASIATLHHLHLSDVLAKILPTLKNGGTLLVLDLYKAEGLSDYATSALAFPINFAMRWIKNGWSRPSAETQEAWAEHGSTDVYPTLSAVRGECAGVLPHAQIKRHLFFRYSLIWKKSS